MDLYTFTTDTVQKLGLSVDQPTRERIVSSLRVAGFSRVEGSEEERIAEGILVKQVRRLAKVQGRNRFAAASPKEEFKRINDLNSKGTCGKCKKPMKEAKLSDGEDVNFCSSCLVTLWK
jgi:hypothetical protein